ncbi:MAG TPA: pyridoxal-dependent decarboxylase [Gemmatimonadaceae bacterium]|nr:pyridoxal-dependent decarboxylase [Gemmatimonadaceae bacterium]
MSTTAEHRTKSPLRDAYEESRLLADVAERATRYLSEIDERRVFPSRDALEALSAFDVPLQERPISPAEVVDELDRLASPATTAIAGPRFFGFVNGSGLPAAVAANWLSTAWEHHGGFWVLAPAGTKIEQVALRWTIELLGLPAESAGAFVTGTTMAHVTGLAAARSSLLAQVGWDVEADGLFGAPPITVIVGAEAHPSLFKALGIIGLGRDRVITVPVDAQGRMRADSLPEIAGPTIVCVQAGNVNTGAFDPFREIAARVKESRAPAWIHVDGAFGLWARVAPARAHLADGVELADSWATDGHKWLNTPYDCGIAVVREGEALRRAMSTSAAYLPSGSDHVNLSDFTPEMSRRPRGLDVWAVLRSLGRSGLADLVERNCRLARRFADAFAADGFPVLNDVVLNQVLVSFGDPERTRKVIAAIQEDGTCWCGVTVWQGKTAMRVSVISWATTEADVDRSVEAILRIARRTS